jgi:hypothetical protein
LMRRADSNPAKSSQDRRRLPEIEHSASYWLSEDNLLTS